MRMHVLLANIQTNDAHRRVFTSQQRALAHNRTEQELECERGGHKHTHRDTYIELEYY